MKKILRDSVWQMIHDFNGPKCTVNAILSNLKRNVEEKTLSDEILLRKLDLIDERMKRMQDAMDVLYEQTKESELWLKPL